MIYLTAVCPDRHDPERVPYVATPIGPYRPDETERMEAGRAWLRDVYHTEDVRRVETARSTEDFDQARAMVLSVVLEEWRSLALKAEAARAQAALDHMRPERWSICDV